MRFDSKDQVRNDVDQHVDRLDTLGEHLDQRAADFERINKLLKELRDGGTAETLRVVQDSVGEASHEVQSRFGADHAELKAEESEAELLEQDVRDEAHADQSNADEIATVVNDLHTDSATDSLDRAASKLQDEAEVLDTEAERLRERREMSLEEAQRLARRVMDSP